MLALRTDCTKVFKVSRLKKKMPGNSFGEAFRVTTWGESHGRAVGVVVDGCPAGLEITKEDIQRELDRRKPGKSEFVSARKEEDEVEILSGIFQGRTLGTPISMLVWNRDVDSKPYEPMKSIPRPGHADITYTLKYGFRDYRGGGRASARETVGRVAAGAIAKRLLEALYNTEILGHVVEIGGVRAREGLSVEEIRRNAERNAVRCADLNAARKMEERIREAKASGDSVGGIVEVIALNVPAGLGEPVFDKLDADIAKALMSIGAVKGVEIGAGFQSARILGSEMNDEFFINGKKVRMKMNRAGGILGGISTGEPIVCRIAVKPTPSISKKQQSVDIERMEEVELSIKGRHDPCICPRIVPVAEAMLAIVLADHALRARNARLNAKE